MDLRAKNILENQDTPEDILDNPRDVPRGILGLAGGDGNGLGSTICFGVNIVFRHVPLV